MSKKNKGGKTVSAKTLASVKAKAAEPAKAVENQTPAAKPAAKKIPDNLTVYQKAVAFRKHPHMMCLNWKIEKDAKGIENIIENWKNSETGATEGLQYPVTCVKEGDGIDVERIRNGVTNPINTQEPEKKEEEPEKKAVEATQKPADEPKTTKKANDKPATKKAEKQPKKPSKKDEVLIPETVEEPEKKAPAALTLTSKTNTDTIDANHSIDLLNALQKRRDEYVKEGLNELHQSTGKQVDVMLFVLLDQWNTQVSNNAEAAGIKLNQQVFEEIRAAGNQLLGTKLLGTKTPDGQLELDFKKSIENAPQETKDALKADATVKAATELPDASTCTTEEDKVNALRSILKMKNGMSTNLQNAVDFARAAFDLKDAPTAQVLAVIFDKLNSTPSTLMLGFTNAVFKNLQENHSIIPAHAWLKTKFPQYDDKQISQMVQVFVSRGIADKAQHENVAFDKLVGTYSNLISDANDDLINRIVDLKEGDKNYEKNLSKICLTKDYKNIGITDSHINPAKVVNYVKLAYGTDMDNKSLKTQMKQIIALYHGNKIGAPLFYIEKSAYASK
jgi:hypothetical protein